MTNRRRRRTRHSRRPAAVRPHHRPPALGSGPGGRLGTYVVTDDQTGQTCTFSDADIVTEGFRTIRTGERVRFLTDPATPGHAVYVIRLDLPDVEDYYA